MQMIRDYSFSLVLSSNLSMKKKNHSWWWPMKGLKKCHDKFKKKKKSYLKLLLYPSLKWRYFDYKLHYSPWL